MNEIVLESAQICDPFEDYIFFAEEPVECDPVEEYLTSMEFNEMLFVPGLFGDSTFQNELETDPVKNEEPVNSSSFPTAGPEVPASESKPAAAQAASLPAVETANPSSLFLNTSVASQTTTTSSVSLFSKTVASTGATSFASSATSSSLFTTSSSNQTGPAPPPVPAPPPAHGSGSGKNLSKRKRDSKNEVYASPKKSRTENYEKEELDKCLKEINKQIDAIPSEVIYSSGICSESLKLFDLDDELPYLPPQEEDSEEMIIRELCKELGEEATLESSSCSNKNSSDTDNNTDNNANINTNTTNNTKINTNTSNNTNTNANNNNNGNSGYDSATNSNRIGNHNGLPYPTPPMTPPRNSPPEHAPSTLDHVIEFEVHRNTAPGRMISEIFPGSRDTRTAVTELARTFSHIPLQLPERSSLFDRDPSNWCTIADVLKRLRCDNGPVVNENGIREKFAVELDYSMSLITNYFDRENREFNRVNRPPQASDLNEISASATIYWFHGQQLWDDYSSRLETSRPKTEGERQRSLENEKKGGKTEQEKDCKTKNKKGGNTTEEDKRVTEIYCQRCDTYHIRDTSLYREHMFNHHGTLASTRQKIPLPVCLVQTDNDRTYDGYCDWCQQWVSAIQPRHASDSRRDVDISLKRWYLHFQQHIIRQSRVNKRLSEIQALYKARWQVAMSLILRDHTLALMAHGIDSGPQTPHVNRVYQEGQKYYNVIWNQLCELFGDAR